MSKKKTTHVDAIPDLPEHRQLDLVMYFNEHIVKEGDCWNWTGPKDSREGRALWSCMGGHPAARVAYVLFRGKVGSMCVCHKCDNPSCVNPDHLFLGTQKDNLLDMYAKGRGGTGGGCRGINGGENHPSAKLSDADVSDIRAAYSSGRITQKALALAFGIGRPHINAICNGKQRCI